LENNELHSEIIKVKEMLETKDNKWRSSARALENERNDLRFVISQKDFKQQQMEAEVRFKFKCVDTST
jgi:hypothetical protein